MKTIRFSELYGTNNISDIVEIQMIGQMALLLKEKDVKLDVTDLKYAKSVKFCVDFNHVFAVNMNQENIISAKLKNTSKIKLFDMPTCAEPNYVIQNSECVVDLSSILTIGMSNVKETAAIRIICAVLYDFYTKNNKCLFNCYKIYIELNSDYEPEVLGDFLLAVFGTGYFSDNVIISIKQEPYDRENIYEKFRRYVFLKYMERKHYCYMSQSIKAVLENAKENITVNDAFRFVEKYLLKQKKKVVNKIKVGSVFCLAEVTNVLKPRINDERVVIFKGYNEKSNEIILDIIPIQLNTRAGYEFIADNTDSEYSSYFVNEYMDKQRHGRRENIQLTGLAVFDICVDESIVCKLNSKGDKKHRPRNPIKSDSQFLRDTERLYFLDSNKYENLTLYNNSDIYSGGGGYRQYTVRFPVFIFHVLKAQGIMFDEQEFITTYRLTSREIAGDV